MCVYMCIYIYIYVIHFRCSVYKFQFKFTGIRSHVLKVALSFVKHFKRFCQYIIVCKKTRSKKTQTLVWLNLLMRLFWPVAIINMLTQRSSHYREYREQSRQKSPLASLFKLTFKNGGSI